MDTNYKKICSELLKNLPEKQKEVILRRFALQSLASSEGGVKRETLESIGKSFGITRERVRQIENVGLLKLVDELRSSSRKRDGRRNLFLRPSPPFANARVVKEDKSSSSATESRLRDEGGKESEALFDFAAARVFKARPNQ